MQVILILLVLLPVIPLYAQLDADRTDEVAHIGYTRVISEKVDRPLEFSLAMQCDGGDNRYSLEYMTLNDVEQNIYVLSFEATPEELDELYQFFRSSIGNYQNREIELGGAVVSTQLDCHGILKIMGSCPTNAPISVVIKQGNTVHVFTFSSKNIDELFGRKQ